MLDNKQQLDFSDLWTDAQPTVAAYVRGMVRDAHVATDIVQNTAIVLMKKFAAWDSSRAFLPWALGFAKFEILAHFRDSARRRVVFGEELLMNMPTRVIGWTFFVDSHLKMAGRTDGRR